MVQVVDSSTTKLIGSDADRHFLWRFSKSSSEKDGRSRGVRADAVAVNIGKLKIMVQGAICTGDTLGMQLNRRWPKHDHQSCTKPVFVIGRAVFA